MLQKKEKDHERYNRLSDELKDWERTKAALFDHFYRQNKKIEENDQQIQANTTLYARNERINDLKRQINELKHYHNEWEKYKRDREPYERKEHNLMIDAKHENHKLKIELRQLNAGLIPNEKQLKANKLKAQ